MDSTITREEFERLPAADQDKAVEAFVAGFRAAESGGSEDGAAPEP